MNISKCKTACDAECDSDMKLNGVSFAFSLLFFFFFFFEGRGRGVGFCCNGHLFLGALIHVVSRDT